MDTAITQHQSVNNPSINKAVCTRCDELDLECIKPGRITKKLLLKLSPKHFAPINCLRRQIMLTLLFTAFPLCGICITDLTFILITPAYVIPILHIIICAFLLSVIICSYLILLLHSIPRSAASRYLMSESETRPVNR
ncbi:hypothetical protein [Mucilaginibacter jinjuensis]|uniref:RseC/MucC-like positive regulator of sigma(E) n=1 Tax=Mucilaginibacter jinjuensis TaxID=1176721 RepID=A0ABY7TCI1_9SPHI|nr:hypothetical protein [Mucilaginibacter jinjuensis]WCT13884.1 hypothetical protein PQO05_08055 [Mucilaginibacter jinjuensis]